MAHAFAGVGDQQAMDIGHEQDRMRGLDRALDGLKVGQRGKVEHLQRAVVLRRQEQPVARNIGGEMVEVTLVTRQVDAAHYGQRRWRRRRGGPGGTVRGAQQLRGIAHLGLELRQHRMGLRPQRRLVVAGLVGVDRAQRADGLAGGIVQRHLVLEPVAGLVDFQPLLPGADHAQVILVGGLADPADRAARDGHRRIRLAGRNGMRAQDRKVRMGVEQLVDQSLAVVAHRGHRIETIGLGQVLLVRQAAREVIADRHGARLHRLDVIALAIGEDHAERTQRTARGVEQHQLHLVAVAGLVHCQQRLAGADHLQVVGIGRLANAPDIAGDDHVLLAARRHGMDRQHLHLGMGRDLCIDQMLRIAGALRRRAFTRPSQRRKSNHRRPDQNPCTHIRSSPFVLAIVHSG